MGWFVKNNGGYNFMNIEYWTGWRNHREDALKKQKEKEKKSDKPKFKSPKYPKVKYKCWKLEFGLGLSL